MTRSLSFSLDRVITRTPQEQAFSVMALTVIVGSRSLQSSSRTAKPMRFSIRPSARNAKLNPSGLVPTRIISFKETFGLPP